MQDKRYIQVILPLRLGWEPCYCLDGTDTSFQVRIGDRVKVLFAHKPYIGVVSAVDVHPDIAPDRIAAVQELLPHLPAVSAKEIEFWRFLADYYLCTIGEVYKASAAGKPQSQVKRPRLKLPEFITAPDVDPELSALAAVLSKDKPVLYRGGDRAEEYLSVATGCLAGGRGVLLLVPDKGSAKALVERFSGYFGEATVEYWSDVTPARRRLAADRVRSGEPYVLLGTRSSLLLPFESLGLIIVDEEQSPFYKNDSSPRYNARDAAVMLGHIHSAPVVLGSSCPSLESEQNVASGRYSSFGSAASRLLELIDTASEKRKNGMLGCISRKLAEECRKGRIAFIRGFEKQEEVAEAISNVFPGEEERFSVFSVPEASRSDLSEFDTVALLSADSLLRADDFRSDERAFQLLESLNSSCRRLIIQTRSPEHQAFHLEEHGGASALLAERKAFSLPPFTRLVDILVPGAEKTRLLSESLSRRLARAGFKASDSLPRTDGKNLVRIALERDSRLQDRKRALREAVHAFCAERRFSGNVILDVDPA